ncbi:MAG TPA: DUF2007 domain-containing protein [Chryseosolibacter sp.]
MQDQEAIVVLHHFDSGIEANIAKSKLDAYDIPCFLTEENMAALYQQAFAIKVRLHVFEKDREQAYRILFQLQSAGNETTCPQCRSTSVVRDFPQKFSAEFAGALKVIFFGIFMPGKKIFRCQQCNHEF